MMTKITKEVLFLELRPPQIIQNAKLISQPYLKDQNNTKSWLALLTNLRVAKTSMDLDRDLTFRLIVHLSIKIKKLVTIKMGI